MNINSKRLGDLMQIARGGSPRPIKSFLTNEDDGINWIKIGDAEQGCKYIFNTKEKIKKSGLKNSRYVKKGDFLLSNSMSFGRPYILETNGCIHDGWLVLSDYENYFDMNFLYYLLSSKMIQNQFKKLAHGSTVRNLNIDLVSNVLVTIPSIPEQQKIAAEIETSFFEIDKSLGIKRSLLIENKILFKSLLEGCFKENYEIMRIGDLGQVSSGGTPSSKNQDYWQGDIQWYSSGELNNKFTEKSVKRITNEGLMNSNAKLFPKDSLLIGMYDTAAMKMSILKEESTFNQAIVGIAPNKFASAEYLFYTLNYLKESILQQRRGVRQQNLSLAKIKNIEVPIPDIQKQNSIVEKLNFLKQQSLLYEKYLSRVIDNLLDLKSSILTRKIKSEII